MHMVEIDANFVFAKFQEGERERIKTRDGEREREREREDLKSQSDLSVLSAFPTNKKV